MKLCMCGCGQYLTGNQRKFASDACRMRYNRSNKKANANRAGSFAFRSSFDRQVTMRVCFTVVFGVYWQAGDFDLSLINKPKRLRLADDLRYWMGENHPDAKIIGLRVDSVTRER